MKLALVMASMSFGGAQRVAALLSDHWVRRGHHVFLITFESESTDCYELDVAVQRIALNMAAEAQNVFHALAANTRRVMALRRAIRRCGADAVLSFGDQTNIVSVLATRFTGLPCVIAERTDPTRHSIGRVWDALRRLVYPLASALVVQTRALIPWACAVMLGRRRTYVVRNPVRNMQPFVRAQRDEREPMVIAAGRLAPEKGFDVLLAAFSELQARFPEWRLTILGEGPERPALTALTKTLGIDDRVSFPGWMAEPGEWFAMGDLFVMSSRYEGFPNALLEAMACGLPVISTDCTGSREILTHAVDGVLVPVDSAPALARAMGELMADKELRERLAEAALAVSKRYSPEAVVRQWDSILRAYRVMDKRCRA